MWSIRFFNLVCWSYGSEITLSVSLSACARHVSYTKKKKNHIWKGKWLGSICLLLFGKEIVIWSQSLHTCWTDCCPSTSQHLFALPNLPHRCGAEPQLLHSFFFYLKTLKQIKAAVRFYCPDSRVMPWVCKVYHKALSWTWRMRHREWWSYHLWGLLIFL